MRYDSCRQCTKRRIKCDQGVPRCAKCVKKGLECSGIGKTYRFVENTTPDTILASSPARSRRSKPRNDEGDASDRVADTARPTEYPLNYPAALYKPGQMMLFDHCKLTLPSCAPLEP
jgi:hypothetical protein